MSLQLFINGISLGSVYALVAVGYCLVFSILKFTNFAHGAMITISAFIGYICSIWFGLGLFGTLLCSIIGGAIVGIVGERIAFRKITVRGSSTFYFFVSSLTWGTFLEQIVTIRVGSTFRSYPRFFESLVIRLGPDGQFAVSTVDVFMLGSSLVVLVVFFVLLNKTKFGRAIRAASFDRDTTYLMGIDVYRVIQITFMLAGALAGLAGVFLGITYTLTAQLGSNIVVKGLIASVIGGLGNVWGAVIGALMLGIVENILIYFVGSGWAPVGTFAIMLVFLLIRPQGLFGVLVQDKA